MRNVNLICCNEKWKQNPKTKRREKGVRGQTVFELILSAWCALRMTVHYTYIYIFELQFKIVLKILVVLIFN